MIVYLIAYAVSMTAAWRGYYFPSGFALMAAAVYLYWKDYKASGNLVHLRGLFSLFWIGGQGISCFKLSRLQTDWSLETWLCFLAAYVSFYMVFEALLRRYPEKRTKGTGIWEENGRPQGKCLYWSVFVVTAVSLAAFLLEAAVLGYVPFFLRGVPHAYSEFHISGVHYFTVSCVLVPGLSVIWYFRCCSEDKRKRLAVAAANVVSLAIPVLCVSRFQLILAVGLAVLVYICVKEGISFKMAAGLAAAMIPAYVILTIARSHDVAYLNGIFEMKQDTPIFITQPYMYIANNYDNFNCLVNQLPEHTWGLRMLFPLWAFTGLKFIRPSLVSFPIYVTKKELTTVTLFYDAYYDFGIAGVIVFSALLGAAAWILVKNVRKMKNPAGYLFYGQAAMYFILSFFTTWYSNPATWFYLGITFLIYLGCWWEEKRKIQEIP